MRSCACAESGASAENINAVMISRFIIRTPIPQPAMRGMRGECFMDVSVKRDCDRAMRRRDQRADITQRSGK
jgi:hypothetical protein